MVSNMKAELLMNERVILSNRAFVVITIWKLAKPLEGSAHSVQVPVGTRGGSSLRAAFR